jgi:AcrR family transcriptional regulator
MQDLGPDGKIGCMAPEKWTPERRRELTRQALVESATELFAQRGFHAASLDEIAEAAGFTRGAIYSNFDSKEELFLAVLEKHVSEQLSSFAPLIEQQGGPGSMDTAAIAKAMQETAGDEKWAALSLEFNLYALRNPEVRELLVAQHEKMHDVMVRFVREMTEGSGISFKIPVEDLVAVMDGASWGLSLNALMDPQQARLMELFIKLIDEAALAFPDD